MLKNGRLTEKHKESKKKVICVGRERKVFVTAERGTEKKLICCNVTDFKTNPSEQADQVNNDKKLPVVGKISLLQNQKGVFIKRFTEIE